MFTLLTFPHSSLLIHTQVSGLKGLPMAGDDLKVVVSEQRARDVAAARTDRADVFRASRMAGALHSQVILSTGAQ